MPTNTYQALNYGFRANASPNLALFSMALVSTSPEMVNNDFGRHSCWMRALAMPALFTRAFNVVSGSNMCWVPTVMVLSLVEKLWITSAPTAVKGLTKW